MGTHPSAQKSGAITGHLEILKKSHPSYHLQGCKYCASSATKGLKVLSHSAPLAILAGGNT
jgi:hypothetical protein